jgi:hypothetical protein
MAKTVLEGTKTERDVAADKKLKDAQTRIAELEDQQRTLTTPPAPPAPTAKDVKKSFLDGGTFFHD